MDGLVDSLTEDQFLGWMATAILDGWFNGWTQTAEVLAQLHNQTNRLEAIQCSDPRQAVSRQEWVSGYEVAKRFTTFKKKKRKRPGMTPKEFWEKIK